MDRYPVSYKKSPGHGAPGLSDKHKVVSGWEAGPPAIDAFHNMVRQRGGLGPLSRQEFEGILIEYGQVYNEDVRVRLLQQRAEYEHYVLPHIKNVERFGRPTVFFEDRTWQGYEGADTEMFHPYFRKPKYADSGGFKWPYGGSFGGGGATGSWDYYAKDVACSTVTAEGWQIPPNSTWTFALCNGVAQGINCAYDGDARYGDFLIAHRTTCISNVASGCSSGVGAISKAILHTAPWLAYQHNAGTVSLDKHKTGNANPDNYWRIGQWNFTASPSPDPGDPANWVQSCRAPYMIPNTEKEPRRPRWKEGVAPPGTQPTAEEQGLEEPRDTPERKRDLGHYNPYSDPAIRPRIPPDVVVVLPPGGPSPGPGPGPERPPVVGPGPGVPRVTRRPGSDRSIKVGKKEKEHKLSLRSALGRVWVGINLFTEIEDALRSMHDAMPKKYQAKKWQPDGSRTQVRDMLPHLYRHGRTANFAQAIENLVNNEIEDWYYGLILGKAGKFINQKLNLPTGGNRIASMAAKEAGLPPPPKVDLTDTGVGMWWIDIGG